MMQDGLHIGLAAWINEQRNTGSFLAYPTMPIITALVDLEAVQNVHDLAKAAEFARLVNFIPHQGQMADTFSDAAILWRVHRDILIQMDHATEPWTSAEEARYQAARKVLYTIDSSGLPAPSQQLLLYEEMRNAYQDLSRSGGSSGEIAQAMSNWVVLGHKLLIEDAFEVIGRLSSRSSRNQAQNEALLLNEDPPGVGLRFYGDMEFAPTYFAPISAIARETWMEAKVSFDDLDHAVGDTQPNGKWKAFRANRSGEVLFDYVVLQCIRPWYTATLYQANDWKLGTNSLMVSKGNGTEGLLPAYVDAIYLVSVKNVTTASRPSFPLPIEPQPPSPRPSGPRLPFPPPSGPRLPFPPHFPPAELSPQTLQTKPIYVADSSIGVVKRAVNTPMATRMVATTSGSLVALQLSSAEASTSATERFAAMYLGQVRRVTADDLNRRYTLVHELLEGAGWPAFTSTEDPMYAEIYVAGFGCQIIPFSPNPNPNYQWE
jgi:hypothetical protein